MTDADDQFEGWLDRQRAEPLSPAPGAYERITRSARRRRTVRAAAVAAAVAVVLTGVTGVAYRIATGPAPVLPPGASATPSRSAPASPTPPSPEPPVPAGPPSSPAASSTPVQSTRCHTGELQVTGRGAEGGGAAGNLYALLVFTNVSGRTCSLFGFPGVSWLTGPSGQQVNDPNQRMTGTTPARVVLPPHGVAHAVVRHGQPDVFGPDCHPVEVAGFRVYPPDETASVFVPWTDRVCSANGVGVGSVSPIAAGSAP